MGMKLIMAVCFLPCVLILFGMLYMEGTVVLQNICFLIPSKPVFLAFFVSIFLNYFVVLYCIIMENMVKWQ